MTRRYIHFCDMLLFCEPLNFLKQQSHAAMPSILGESIDKAHPGGQFCRLNIVFLRICAKRNQFIAIRQQQHLGISSSSIKKSPFAEHLMQISTRVPIAFPYLFQPVFLPVAFKKVDYLHRFPPATSCSQDDYTTLLFYRATSALPMLFCMITRAADSSNFAAGTRRVRRRSARTPPGTGRGRPWGWASGGRRL